ncbi:MAG: hypothetical protein JXQ89_08470 [Pelagimonas sp.]
MDLSTRIFLTCLALVPLAFLVFPLPAFGPQIAGSAASGMGSVLAFAASLRRRTSETVLRRNTSSLLIAKLPTAQRKNMPEQSVMRAELEILEALHFCPQGGTPADRNLAIARILKRFCDAWKAPSIQALRGCEVLELYLLNMALRASPGEAGRLAQFFARPDTVLTLKDDVDLIVEKRAAWDRGQAAYLATQCLFRHQRSGLGMPSLLTALRTLSAPDPDLWHFVVSCHNPQDAAQRAAAIWCLQQPNCDRATAAHFLTGLAESDILITAALHNDMSFVIGVRDVISRWNAGGYTSHVLGFDPETTPTSSEAQLENMCANIARLTGATQYPVPHKIFTPLLGRAARNREHWDLKNGQINAQPVLVDYLP